MLRAVAPAKINLFLHILGRRANGYHELQSLVVFSAFGDEVEVESASGSGLDVVASGSWAKAIEGVANQDNLVIRAAQALRERTGKPSLGARIRLSKEIPVGAGLGGGSSDAAATLKLLNRIWDLGLPLSELESIGLALGADVPVCLRARSSLVEGIGEGLSDVPQLPALSLVLAHTGEVLPTAPVFKDLRRDEWSAAPARLPSSFARIEDLISCLEHARNDLQAPALRLQPAIARLLDDIADRDGCRLARMSGSGAACFGIFAGRSAAEAATTQLKRKGWWATPTQLI